MLTGKLSANLSVWVVWVCVVQGILIRLSS
ncbi:hypothetical protein LINPERHAP1_LOCUS9832 [Linum perenne]